MAERIETKYNIRTNCFQDEYSHEDDFLQYINDKLANASPFKKADRIECVKLNETNFEIKSDYKFNKNIIRQYLSKYLRNAQLSEYMGIKGTEDGFEIYYFSDRDDE